jgi:hypothetical protein
MLYIEYTYNTLVVQRKETRVFASRFRFPMKGNTIGNGCLSAKQALKRKGNGRLARSKHKFYPCGATYLPLLLYN